MKESLNFTTILIVAGLFIVGAGLGWLLTRHQISAMGPSPEPQSDNPAREAKTEKEVAEEQGLKEGKEDPRPVTSILSLVQENKERISSIKESQAQGTSAAAQASLKKLKDLNKGKTGDSKKLSEDGSSTATTVASNAALATALLADLTPAGDKTPEGYEEENTPAEPSETVSTDTYTSGASYESSSSDSYSSSPYSSSDSYSSSSSSYSSSSDYGSSSSSFSSDSGSSF